MLLTEIDMFTRGVLGRKRPDGTALAPRTRPGEEGTRATVGMNMLSEGQVGNLPSQRPGSPVQDVMSGLAGLIHDSPAHAHAVLA